jgi:hypothetical protein
LVDVLPKVEDEGILAPINWPREFNKEPKAFTGIKTRFSRICGFALRSFPWRTFANSAIF